MDARSTQRSRVNRNRPIHQPNSLLHAREIETSALHCRFQVEPSPQITGEEMNPTGILPQLYFNPFHPAVFDGIVHGLPSNILVTISRSIPVIA